MENCLYHPSLPSSPGPHLIHSLSPKPTLRFFINLRRKPVLGGCFYLRRRPIKVKASAGASHCESSSLNSPLEPRSVVGKFLTNVLQNHRQLFNVAVGEELNLLVNDRDAAVARMVLSTGSDEALLHRRIARTKEHQCQIAVQDVMYLLIFYKFSEIRVPLVPQLSRCTYNGRLEILPSKDWELESIYSLEVLDVIREHVTTVTGLRANSSVTESWATTKIRQALLAQTYVASILYGYFLKSVSLRYHPERSLSMANHDLHLGHKTSLSFQRCAKLRSKEAVNLVESYSLALFGNEEPGLVESDDIILTSFSSLKRLVLEAVAFGSFLWETEDYIDNVYKLKDN